MKISEFNNLSMNVAADYYYYELGANTLPADPLNNKKPLVNWLQYQNERIPGEVFEDWKARNLFENGILVIVGKLFRSHYGETYYLIGIDFDNSAAIEAITIRKPLEEFTREGIIVEQHVGNRNRSHALFLSRHPYKKLNNYLTNNKNVPRIEIKGSGEHGVMRVSPTMDKDGTKYQVIGYPEDNLQIGISDTFDRVIDAILSKDGVSYLNGDNANSNFSGNPNQIPIRELFKEYTVIYEGNNRHEALLRVMESLLKRNYGILSLDETRQLSQNWNQKHCKPPLDDDQFEKQWKDATRFIGKQVEQEQENNYNYNNNNNQQELEKYPELQGNIYHKINEKPEKYIVADKRTNQLKEYEAKRMDVKGGRDPDIIKYYLVDTNTYLGCIPEKIIKHKNPLTFLRIPELYTITFVDISGDRFTLKQKTLTHILGSLKDRACVFKDGANNALNVIVQAFKKRQLVEISEDIPYIGFLPLEGNKIRVSNVEIKQPSSDEVAQALSVIEQAGEEFYKKRKNRLDLLATAMVWVMIAPFNFVMKTDNYFLKLLSFYGVANSTKTNTALITLAVDGHHEEKEENIYILSYGSVDSSAKFGEAFGETTFPILVDEIEDLTDERRRSPFTENMKTLAGKKILRKRTSYNRNGEMDEFPALSCAILVSNYAPPLHDSGYMRRTITRNFPVDESIDPDDPITKIFERFLDRNLPKLKALGDFRNWYVMNHQEIIFDKNKPKPLDIGLETLKAAYSYARKEIPEWLVKERIPERQLVESIQENDVIIKSAFEKYINEQVIKALPVWRQENNEFVLPNKIDQKFVKLIESDLLPDVKFNKSSEILISKGILIELNRHGVNKDQLTDLKSLANYMGGEYRKNNNIFVVITKTKLIDYFSTVIDDQMKIDENYGSNGNNGSL